MAETNVRRQLERSDISESAAEILYLKKQDKNKVQEELEKRGLVVEKGTERWTINCSPFCTVEKESNCLGYYSLPGPLSPYGAFLCPKAPQKDIADLVVDGLKLRLHDAIDRARLNIPPHLFDKTIALSELHLASSGRYFKRGAGLVKLTGEQGNFKLIVPNECDLRKDFAESIQVYRFDSKDHKMKHPIPTEMPSKIIKTILLKQDHENFPEIKCVVHQPCFGPGFRPVLKSGYDPMSKIFADFDDKKFKINKSVSWDTAKNNWAFIKENCLKEFSFVETVDESAALCALLTVIVRQALPTAPLFLVTAPMQGTGKTFLVSLISLFAQKKDVSPTAFPVDNNEFHRVLFGKMLEGNKIILFDNVSENIPPFDGLCTAITSGKLDGRLLGTNKIIETDLVATLFITGNNISPLRDLSRRCVPIFLDSNLEVPFSKRYKNPFLLEKVRNQREFFVSKLFEIVLAFINCKIERVSLTPVASFIEWSEVPRQIAFALTGEDPASRLFEGVLKDPDRELNRRMFCLLFEKYSSRPFQVRDLISDFKLEEDNDFWDCLEETGCSSASGLNKKKFGCWLNKRQNMICGELRLEKGGTDSHNRVNTYRLIKLK